MVGFMNWLCTLDLGNIMHLQSVQSVAVILQITSFLKFISLQYWYSRFVGGDTNESYAIRITSMLVFLLHNSMNELWRFLIVYHIG